MAGHALLSASSSKRWLNCTPSARLTENMSDEESEFAKEGTDAHALCEYKVKQALGEDVTDPTPTLFYYSEEMEDCAKAYCDFVLNAFNEAKQLCCDPVLLVEQRLDYSKYVKEGFGTGDCVIIADGLVHIIDYKHGKGVKVDSNHNTQMMLYAIGAIGLFEDLYSCDTVKMTIFQPRVNNISTYTMSKEDLIAWAENELKPKAELAFLGEGEAVAGEWCQFCKLRSKCQTLASSNLDLEKYSYAAPSSLTDDEIEEILGKIDNLVSWANEVKAYAEAEAINGRKFNGYKLVESRTTRKYADEQKVADILTAEGIDPYEKKLRSITELQKLIGKTKFEFLLDGYIQKPQGRPVLVPDSDKRPEITNGN